MKKQTIIYILVLVVIFIVVYSITDTLMKKNNDTYSCYDYTSDTYYTFKTEQEMHEVCDQFDDNNINNYTIYDELINTDDNNGYSFDPYVRDNELVIIVAITDCTNPEQAKENARKWFSDHSYDINNFKIEYENPCE